MRKVIFFILCMICLSLVLVSCSFTNSQLSFVPNSNDYPMIEEAPNEESVNDSSGQIDEPKTEETETPPTVPTVEDKYVSLDDIHVIDSSATYHYSSGDFTDTFGNKHHTYHSFRGSNDENYAIFNLNGEYKSFSGGFVLLDGDGSTSHYYVTIYTDGKKVYESEEIARTTGEVDFTLDVSGCMQMKIEVVGSALGTGVKLINAELESQ